MLDLIIMLLFIAICLPYWNSFLPLWFCKYMGWHLKPDKIGTDGYSLSGVCPRCGKYVLQDSQGNWF